MGWTDDGKLAFRKFFDREFTVMRANMDAHVGENPQLRFRQFPECDFPIRLFTVLDLNIFNTLKGTVGRLYFIGIFLTIATHVSLHEWDCIARPMIALGGKPSFMKRHL